MTHLVAIAKGQVWTNSHIGMVIYIRGINNSMVLYDYEDKSLEDNSKNVAMLATIHNLLQVLISTGFQLAEESVPT